MPINKPDAVNHAIASWLAVVHHWYMDTDPGRQQLVAKPLDEATKNWEIRHQRRHDTRHRWEMPLFIAWGGALVAWHFLVYHFCPNTFNPHDFNPRIHQIITEHGDLINDASQVADEDGYAYFDKWRDPRTKVIYTPKHRDVIRGVRSEKIARAVVTFLCGLPLLGVYRLRAREMGGDDSELGELTLTGVLICLGCGVVSYFVPVVQFVSALFGSSR